MLTRAARLWTPCHLAVYHVAPVREEPSKYEAVGLTLVTVAEDNFGGVLASYPEPESLLTVDSMFARIYKEYDLRYLYQAPALGSKTRRIEWAPESEALGKDFLLDYEPRVRGH